MGSDSKQNTVRIVAEHFPGINEALTEAVSDAYLQGAEDSLEDVEEYDVADLLEARRDRDKAREALSQSRDSEYNLRNERDRIKAALEIVRLERYQLRTAASQTIKFGCARPKVDGKYDRARCGKKNGRCHVCLTKEAIRKGPL